MIRPANPVDSYFGGCHTPPYPPQVSPLCVMYDANRKMSITVKGRKCLTGIYFSHRLQVNKRPATQATQLV